MAQTNFPLWQQSVAADYQDVYAPQIEAMRAKLAKPMAAMYTPEEMQQRRDANNREYQLGMLGLLSGDESLGNVGGHVLKQAMANRQQRVTERGVADPITGQFNYNPEYLREKDEAGLAALENRRSGDLSNYLSARNAAAERAALAAQNAEDRRQLRMLMGGGERGGGNFTPTAVTRDGQQVVTNSKTGMSYVISLDPSGKPTYTPYQGPMTPKGTFEKQVQDVNEQLGAAKRAQDLLTTVQSNPDAFGMRASGVAALPAWAQGRAGSMVGLSPEQRRVRAGVFREAAIELNRIYGAAQSAGELGRATAWAYDKNDDLETILTKLAAARDWAVSNAAMQGPAAMGAATARAPNLTPEPEAAAPAAVGGQGWGMRKLPGK